MNWILWISLKDIRRVGDKCNSCKKDEVFQYDVPADLVAVVAWPGKINLETSIKNGQIIWKSPIREDVNVYVIKAKNKYLLHPDYGKTLVDVYFNRFENKMDSVGKAGMNYFFRMNYHIQSV